MMGECGRCLCRSWVEAEGGWISLGSFGHSVAGGGQEG